MRISAISVDNFKRIDHVDIAPHADKVLVLIGGKNANGKSSLLDALTAAFGGKSCVPSDPVRHGAETAEICVELDGGALSIKRTIRPDGESVLEVRDPEGKVRSPQAVLDKIVGARFLDPLAFIHMNPADQRKALLAVIDREGKIAALDAKRVRVYDRRTEVGRDHRKAVAQLGAMPEIKPGKMIDVDEVLAEQRNFGAKRRELGDARQLQLNAQSASDTAERKVTDLEEELARIAQRLEEAEAARELCRTRVEEATANAVQLELDAGDADKRHAEATAKLQKAGEHNRQVTIDETAAKRRAEVAAEVEELSKSVETYTADIEKIDAEKAAFLASSPLPVKGLDVDATGVRFNGVPFSQASDAEQLRVALALAVAAAPNLRDVWVKDGALLDDESMAALETEAAAQKVTVWLERVGTKDPGAIVIHDGRVREEVKRAAG